MAMAVSSSGKRRSFYGDLDQLRSHFDSLDQDKTGYIGYDELKQLVQKMSNLEEAILPELMAKLDRDNDGKVSFDDFQALFEVEDSSSKKMKITSADYSPNNNPSYPPKSDYGLDGSLTSDLPIIVSPQRKLNREGVVKMSGNRVLPETPTVVLRHKPRSQRRLPNNDGQFGMLSPISSTPTRPQSTGRPLSNESPDLATQMQYLTGIEATDNPQIRRNSRVLSWINESEDLLFEDTGDSFNFKGLGNAENPVISPPVSPIRRGEEASHVTAILESVLHCKQIDRDSIAKLCAHVNADTQEKEELLALLEHLDKKRIGFVTLDEFVIGLQVAKNTAQVASTPFKSPENLPPSQRPFNGQPIPRLSEPFSTPTAKLSSTPFVSTPVGVQPGHSSTVLSVLDLDNSGYVKVDSLIDHIQQMGVDVGHDTSLEEALSEVVTVDPMGRISVNEFTSTLEDAIVTEGKTNNFLRQIALKSFKSEITSLRSQIHQVSLERDTIRSTLNRTLDENKKLAQEGEDHVDMVTKRSERKLKEQEYELTQRLKETERTRQEETNQMQERASTVINTMEDKMEQLKAVESKLRSDLKLAEDEVSLISENMRKAYTELKRNDTIIATLQRDLESRSDLNLEGDEHQLSHIHELENEISERGSSISQLQENLRETKDQFDLLIAENEKLKQEYLSSKREYQKLKNSSRFRRKSSDSSTKSNCSSSGTRFGIADMSKRHQKIKRPLSGSYFGRSTPIRPHIFKSPLDLAIGQESDHPVLFEDIDGPSPDYSDHETVSLLEGDKVEEDYLAEQTQEARENTSSEEMSTPTEADSEEDDQFSRSATSLMEEIQNQEQQSALNKKIEQLEQDKALLEANYQLLEKQLIDAEESDRKDIRKELEKSKKKQEELDRLIQSLARQSRKLSKTRMEIDSKLQIAEQSMASQLQGIHGLRSIFADNSDSGSTSNLVDLIEELETTRSRLETEQKSHEESISSLKEQLSRAEEYSYTQTDQSLKLEEEKAHIAKELLFEQEALQADRRAYEAEINILTRKLDNAEQSLTQHEASHIKSMQQARVNLETAYAEVDQYKLQKEELEIQLKEMQDKLQAVKKPDKSTLLKEPPNDVISTECGIQVGGELREPFNDKTSMECGVQVGGELQEPSNDKTSMECGVQVGGEGTASLHIDEVKQLRSSLIEMQDEYKKVTEQYECLQNNFDFLHSKMLASEHSTEAEMSTLRSQLSDAKTEVEKLSSQNKSQLSCLKEMDKELKSLTKREATLSETLSSSTRRFETSKTEYKEKLQNIANELKIKECHRKELEQELSQVRSKSKNALTEVSEFSSRESKLQEQIVKLREKETRLEYEVSELKTEIDKHDELVQPQLTETSLHKLPDNLGEEISNKTPNKVRRDTANYDEIDFIPAPILTSKLHTHANHEEIIGQMKNQLEELQNILVHQTKGGKLGEGTTELNLVQKLLTENEALASEVRQAKQVFLADRERLAKEVAIRDKLLFESKAQASSEKKSLQTLAQVTSCAIFSQLSRFEDSSCESLVDYETRIEGVVSKVAALSAALKDINKIHHGAMDEVISDLEQSQVKADNYREEISRLKQELDESHRSYEEMERFKDEIIDLQTVKQTEGYNSNAQTQTNTLDTQFQPAQPTQNTPKSSERRRVDEVSGQISPGQGEMDKYRNGESEMLKQQKDEIHDLKEELDKVRRLERHARVKAEETEQQLADRERIIEEIKKETESKERMIHKLETNLHSVVDEHVESVIQYIEVQPLESINEALLMHSREPQEETVVAEAPKEQLETRQVIEEVYLKEDATAGLVEELREAEEKLLVLRQIEETLKVQHQQEINEIESKHDTELSITKEVIDEHTHDLRQMYISLVDERADKQRTLRLTHSQLVNEVKKEIQIIKSELENEQSITSEMGATLSKKMEEHEELETQIQTEHDEEVKALSQQKQALIRQLEEMKMKYYRSTHEQDQRSNVLLQDLVNAKSQLEKQLQQKTEESLIVYQQLANLIEEKRVLMDIVEKVCFEAAERIDVV